MPVPNQKSLGHAVLTSYSAQIIPTQILLSLKSKCSFNMNMSEMNKYKQSLAFKISSKGLFRTVCRICLLLLVYLLKRLIPQHFKTHLQIQNWTGSHTIVDLRSFAFHLHCKVRRNSAPTPQRIKLLRKRRPWEPGIGFRVQIE